MIEMIDTTCTKCGEPMRLPEHVANLPADERLCGACVKKLKKLSYWKTIAKRLI